MMLKIVNAREQKLTDEDFRRLAEIEEPEVAKWDVPAYGGDLEKAYDAFKKTIENLQESEDEFLVARVDGRTVGFVGIHRLKGEIRDMKHVGEVGIMVHPDFQRRGIGTELLKACLNLAKRRGFKRLEADTLANNKAMRRILEKVGFKLEGVRLERFKRNEEYLDEACYGFSL